MQTDKMCIPIILFEFLETEMRGSALIFNCLDELDPETLDKIDDLASLDSLHLEDDLEQCERLQFSRNTLEKSYNSQNERETRNSLTHSQEYDSFHTQLQNDATANSEKENYSKNVAKKSNNSRDTIKSFPIVKSQFSSSPLNKSNYFPQPPMNGKTFTSTANGARLPLSRISKELTSSAKTYSIVPDNNCRNENFGGFSRFLFRSNKTDKNKFDVNNLSPQLRDETRRIYVY